MKKVLVSVLLSVCVTVIGCIGYVNYIFDNYEEQICDIELCFEAIDENYKTVKAEYEALEEQMWRVMNDEDYVFTIEHEGNYHTYTRTKENWFFTDKTHIVSGEKTE